MNYLKKQQFRKELLNNLTSDCKVNWFKIRANESVEHAILKLRKAHELVKLGHEVVIEAKFRSGGRADILDITDYKIFEVLHSEKLADAKKKVLKYPDYLEVEFLE